MIETLAWVGVGIFTVLGFCVIVRYVQILMDDIELTGRQYEVDGE